MTQQYRFPPKFTDGVVEGQRTSPTWYRYIQALDGGQPPAPETVVKVTASPFTYQAPMGGFVIVQGGTVSVIKVERSGTFYTSGATSGPFPLSQGDQLQITYSGLPKVIFFPA